MSEVVPLREVVLFEPRFTVDSDCEHDGWSIRGVMDGDTEEGITVEEIVTLEKAFMIPGRSTYAPEAYVEFGDMVSMDAQMSAHTYNAVVEASLRSCQFDFDVCGNPPWFHLGTVEVKEEYRGQRLSHRMVSGFIEFIESFVGEDAPYVLTATCAEGLVPHWEALGFKVRGRVHDFGKVHVLLLRLGGELVVPPLEEAPAAPTPFEFQGWIKAMSGKSRATSVMTEATYRVFDDALRLSEDGWDVRLMRWANNDGSLAHAPCFPIVAQKGGRVLLLGTEDKGWWAVGRRVVELRGTGEFRATGTESRFEVVRQSDPFGGHGWRGEMLSTGFSWAVEGRRGD